jgi:hypothetical protein
MGNFDTAWLRTESTQDVHDAMRVASRRNVSWKRSTVITMDYAEWSALAS